MHIACRHTSTQAHRHTSTPAQKHIGTQPHRDTCTQTNRHTRVSATTAASSEQQPQIIQPEGQAGG